MTTHQEVARDLARRVAELQKELLPPDGPPITNPVWRAARDAREALEALVRDLGPWHVVDGAEADEVLFKMGRGGPHRRGAKENDVIWDWYASWAECLVEAAGHPGVEKNIHYRITFRDPRRTRHYIEREVDGSPDGKDTFRLLRTVRLEDKP